MAFHKNECFYTWCLWMNEIHQGRVFAVQSIGPLPASQISNKVTKLENGIGWVTCKRQRANAQHGGGQVRAKTCPCHTCQFGLQNGQRAFCCFSFIFLYATGP
jgi:hypothetical protein